MSLGRILRDRSGRLYELNILVAFLILGTLISVGHKSILKGFGIAALWLFGLFAAIMALYLLSEGVERARDIESVKLFLATRAGRLMKPAAQGFAAAIAGAAVAGFVSMFAAPTLSGTPEGQLMAMRVMTAAGGLFAGALAFVAAKKASTGGA